MGSCSRELQIAKGLQHLYACLIVHRDVKPDNMLLGSGISGGGGVALHADAVDGDDDADLLVVVSDLGECVDCQLHADHDFVLAATHPYGGAPTYHSPEARSCTRLCEGGDVLVFDAPCGAGGWRRDAGARREG